MPAPQGYSRTQILLHWAIAVLLVPQFLFDDGISGAFRTLMKEGSATTTTGAWVHIVPGVAIFVLVLWRLALRLTRGAPEAPGEPGLQRTAGIVVHWLLYALLLIMPVTGMMAWFGAIGTAGEVHEILQNLLLVLIGLHVAAALWHQFGLKDNLLNRMRQPEA